MMIRARALASAGLAGCALLALLLLYGPPASAQRAYPASTPEELILSMGEATRAGDWDGMAGLMHPAALAEVRELFMPLLATPATAEVLPMLFGVETAEEVANLTDAQLFAALMRRVLGEEQMTAELLKSAKVEIVGSVREGADTVHVLSRIRMTYGKASFRSLEVGSAIRDGAVWRGLLSGEIAGLAAMLQEAIDEGAAAPEDGMGDS